MEAGPRSPSCSPQQEVTFKLSPESDSPRWWVVAVLGFGTCDLHMRVPLCQSEEWCARGRRQGDMMCYRVTHKAQKNVRMSLEVPAQVTQCGVMMRPTIQETLLCPRAGREESRRPHCQGGVRRSPGLKLCPLGGEAKASRALCGLGSMCMESKGSVRPGTSQLRVRAGDKCHSGAGSSPSYLVCNPAPC